MLMKAKKSFGQHFLKDHNIARRIAESLQLTDQYQHVLEIGPGKGMLTAHLLELGYSLTVVEADRDMVDHLNIHLPELKDKIISEDFLFPVGYKRARRESVPLFLVCLKRGIESCVFWGGEVVV